ncbi:hypothetical protein CDES_01105 [Corynebacterium deserti GIMN1.010]|uniref:Uncharacterized protein n=2 Tax=Corynebacterium TaxID=1716 RepID=A0A0M4CHI3_9CORY|nr:hypothetical protein CDES_01105 [Corynebacterium deserti GIMN1.010]
MQAAAGSAMIGAGVALRDYVQSPWGRALGYGGLVLSGATVIALGETAEGQRGIFGDDNAVVVDQIRQEIGDLGITPGPESDVDSVIERGPLVTWLLLGLFALTFIALTYLSIRMDFAFMNKLAGFFEKRGATRPFTCTGVIYAAVVYALFEVEMRNR